MARAGLSSQIPYTVSLSADLIELHRAGTRAEPVGEHLPVVREDLPRLHPQPAGSQEPFQVIEPQPTLPLLRGTGERDRYRAHARRADQQMTGERGGHGLERGTGLTRG